MLISTAVVLTLFAAGIAAFVFRSHLRRAMTGTAGMVGEQGVAHTALAPEGQVCVHGEYWQAVSDEPVNPGDKVEVVESSCLPSSCRYGARAVAGTGAGDCNRQLAARVVDR